VKKEIIGRDRYFDDLDALAELIRRDKPGYDVIMAIARGGLMPGVVLSHALGLKVAVVCCASYSGGEQERKLKMSDSIVSIVPIAGRVLLVDELVDTGETVAAVVEAVKAAYPAVTEVAVAVLYKKPNSRFEPDYFVRTLDGWLEFFYERESLLS
jgi:uncharacterized protein